jgi:hypothetical protein
MCIIPPHLAPPAVEDNHHPKHKALENASVMEGLIGRLNAPPSHPEINKPLTRDTGKACTRLNGSDAVEPWCH